MYINESEKNLIDSCLIKENTTKIIHHRHTNSGLAISMTVELYPDHLVWTYVEARKSHRQQNESIYEKEHYEKLVKELSTIQFSARDRRPHPTGGAGYSYSFEVNAERYLSFGNHHQLSGNYNKVQNLILQFIEEHGQCVTLFEKYSKTALEKGRLGKYRKFPQKLQKQKNE